MGDRLSSKLGIGLSGLDFFCQTVMNSTALLMSVMALQLGHVQ